MGSLQKNFLIITFISLCFEYVRSEAKVNIFAVCACEELSYESECKLFPHCVYSNSKCSSKSCSSLDQFTTCQGNMNCAWFNGVCSDFKSCSEYEIPNSKTCTDLHPTCKYNLLTKTCARYDKAYTTPCSDLEKDQCKKGSDGVCLYENGKCKKFAKCSDATWADESCRQAIPACFPNYKTGECDTFDKCSSAQDEQDCYIQPDGMNSVNYFICQLDDNKKCVDFDLKSQTQDTCLFNSYGYYHWTGKTCEICKFSQTLLAITSIILLIVF